MRAATVFAGIILCATASFAQVPRMADGHPDLTGVWQGGSTTPGNWADANSGTGVGGTGTNPNAAVVLSSNDRPAGREGAPRVKWMVVRQLVQLRGYWRLLGHKGRWHR